MTLEEVENMRSQMIQLEIRTALDVVQVYSEFHKATVGTSLEGQASKILTEAGEGILRGLAQINTAYSPADKRVSNG
jgi:hypothetical protein